MHDRQVFRLLGVEPPREIERVDLRLEEGEVHVFLRHRRGVNWPCPQWGRRCKLHDHQPRAQLASTSTSSSIRPFCMRSRRAANAKNTAFRLSACHGQRKGLGLRHFSSVGRSCGCRWPAKAPSRVNLISHGTRCTGSSNGPLSAAWKGERLSPYQSSELTRKHFAKVSDICPWLRSCRLPRPLRRRRTERVQLARLLGYVDFRSKGPHRGDQHGYVGSAGQGSG
jgi:hypothetical protein